MAAFQTCGIDHFIEYDTRRLLRGDNADNDSESRTILRMLLPEIDIFSLGFMLKYPPHFLHWILIAPIPETDITSYLIYRMQVAQNVISYSFHTNVFFLK